MSECAPPPEPDKFPVLDPDEPWVVTLPEATMVARVYNAEGKYPSHWWQFRTFGPVDARFDPHPPPPAESPEHSVMYVVPEQHRGQDSAIAACLIEVFQQQRIIHRTGNGATLALFETTRAIQLLDLSDSDWLTVAGGNAAVSSGPRARSREWARAIFAAYPHIDGIRSASSVVPDARIAALWSRCADAVPDHAHALIRLDRPELSHVIHGVARRYGYLVS